MATRVFISFDYDHDEDLKNLLVGQSRNPDSPFEISDWSLKDASVDWKQKARERIQRSQVVAAICGLHTDTATGVSAELEMAQDESKPYFLLSGRAEGTNKKPDAAHASDKIYRWTWENLKSLIGGAR